MSPLLQTAQMGWTSSWPPSKRLVKRIRWVVRLSAPQSNHPLIATSWLSRPALRSNRKILKNDRKRKRPGVRQPGRYFFSGFERRLKQIPEELIVNLVVVLHFRCLHERAQQTRAAISRRLLQFRITAFHVFA